MRLNDLSGKSDLQHSTRMILRAVYLMSWKTRGKWQLMLAVLTAFAVFPLAAVGAHRRLPMTVPQSSMPSRFPAAARVKGSEIPCRGPCSHQAVKTL